MENLRLYKDFQNDTMRFFRHKAFDGDKLLRKWIGLFVLTLIIYQVVTDQLILPREVIAPAPDQGYWYSALIVFAIIVYYIAIFRFPQTMTKTIYITRYILILIACLCLAISMGVAAYTDLIDRIEHNNVEKWFYSLLLGRSSIWLIILIDIMVPIWYIKLTLPYAYLIASIVAYYHFNLQYKGTLWVFFGIGIVFTAIPWGLKAYYEWREFLSRRNIEAWDDVHRNILDKVPDAIAVIDSNLKVLYSNLTFKSLCKDNLIDLSQKLTNCKSCETNISTSPPSSSNPDETHLTLSEILKNNIASLLRGDHKQLAHYLTFNSKMMVEGNGDQTSSSHSFEIKLGSLLEYNKIILILSDTTQRDLAISLETANHYKDKLLATVSHDLRAPINGSVSLIESSIEHEAVPVFIKEQFLIPAQRSCRFLLHLVNDILDFSQINAQKLRMNFEAGSLTDTIKNCYQLLEMQANRKGIDFRLELGEKLPQTFTTDHNRLSQVIINLLTNAIKFTFSGSVTLSAHIINDLVQIKVIDTGIGIKDEDKEKLFQEFTRIEYEQKNVNTRGIGLGLVIANNLAQRLGPERQQTGISLSSVYGKGSTFEFLIEDKNNIIFFSFLSGRDHDNREEDFLCHEVEERDLTRNISRIPSGLSIQMSSGIRRLSMALQKKQFIGKALVVDDDAINIIALESIMKQYGIVIDAAYNGKEAIEKVMQNNRRSNRILSDGDEERTSATPSKQQQQQLLAKEYQIIFMDCEMPVMNGFEATKALKELMQNNQIDNIPIIGCTGHQDKQTQDNCLDSGMTDVLSKPPVKEKLFKILEKYMEIAY